MDIYSSTAIVRITLSAFPTSVVLVRRKHADFRVQRSPMHQSYKRMTVESPTQPRHGLAVVQGIA
jgi:hypothetical protein